MDTDMKQQKIIEQYNQQITIIVIVGLLFLLRFLLSNRLPIFIIGNSPHDDGWIVRRAVYFLHGQWMGPYDQYTLIKGVFSPLLLAFSIGIGATFQGLNTMLYCSACLNFTIAVRPILKRRWTQLFCLVILLFNPITYALQTGQRIYRNGISQWQLLLIFGSLIALFLRRKNSTRLRPIDADLQVPDTRKFEKHTGWKPQYTFQQTMSDLLNYWRDRIRLTGVYLDR